MGKELRRFPRFAASVAVVLKRKGGTDALRTSDVSRHGAFVMTDAPRAERELVQLTFQLPDGVIDVMCMVVRSLRPGAGTGPGMQPGMGVDFFALSKDAKNIWEAFVHDLKIRGAPLGGPKAAAPAEPAPALPAPTADKDAPTRREHERHKACFLVKLADRAAMHEMVTKDIGQGGTFLRTPLLREPGEVVELVLVHPETDEEFRIDGIIVRAIDHEVPSERGLALRFGRIEADAAARLEAFIDSGVAHVERVVDKLAVRFEELRAAAAAEPDSPDAHEDLGLFLGEAGDHAGAVTSLTRALILAPSHPEIHAALARSYRQLGDVARASSHDRVAMVLTLYRDDRRLTGE